jgi:hypothetical protein
MDTNSPSPVPQRRSEAQAEAARVNGTKSAGPVTAAGKVISSANSIHHGLSASSVLLPSESREDYQSNLAGWVETLKPASPGEAQITARIADLSFRQQRLQRLEDRHQAASLDLELQMTRVHRQLQAARNASKGLEALVGAVATVKKDAPVESVVGLASPIRGVMELLKDVELAPEVSVPLEAAYESLQKEMLGQTVPVAVFTRLAEVGGKTLEALTAKVVELEGQVAVEKEKIADEQLLGDDKELKRLERHRNMLNRALDAELARLRVVRELASAASGSSCAAFGPIRVELRVVGRRESGGAT